MLRLNRGAPILLGILLLNGCTKAKTYQITSNSKVPTEVAAALEGLTFHEGRNLLVDFDNKDRLYGVITNGQLESLTLEVKDQKPETIIIARMPDPSPQPPIETPQGCDQIYDNCLARCTDRCCRLECYFQWTKCIDEPGHPPGIGLTIM